MNNKDNGHVRFVEVQYFWQQPLAWIVWLVAAVMLIWLRNIDLITESFGTIATVFVLAIMMLVIFTKLTTEISEEGIRYRMWPFHKKSRLLPWSEIQQAEVRKYRPIREYGGFGVRIGGNGKAYNIKGNMGLQIQLNSGQNILIGTQRPDEIQEVLDTLSENSI